MFTRFPIALLTLILITSTSCGPEFVSVCWSTEKEKYYGYTFESCHWSMELCLYDGYGNFDQCCDAKGLPEDFWSKETDPACSPKNACDEAYSNCLQEGSEYRVPLDLCLDEYSKLCDGMDKNSQTPECEEKMLTCNVMYDTLVLNLDTCTLEYEQCSDSPSTPTTSDGNGESPTSNPEVTTGEDNLESTSSSVGGGETGTTGDNLGTSSSEESSSTTSVFSDCGNGLLEEGEACDNGLCEVQQGVCTQGFCSKEPSKSCNGDEPHPQQVTCSSMCTLVPPNN